MLLYELGVAERARRRGVVTEPDNVAAHRTYARTGARIDDEPQTMVEWCLRERDVPG